MFLVDTNVWLELLLDQRQAEAARHFLQGVDVQLLAITEFSLYSIGIILTRFGQDDVFREFLADVLHTSGVARVRLDVPDLGQVIDARRQYNLDFDDAYQYVAATKYGYTLVSFDHDFDRTERGRKTPQQAMAH